MDFQAFLDDISNSADYADQMVYVRESDAREPRFAELSRPLSPQVRELLERQGIERLYTHQAEAVDLVREGKDVLIVTGTASGKSPCYTIPIVEMLLEDPDAKVLLLFPTKALCQDQYQRFALVGLGVGGQGSGKERAMGSGVGGWGSGKERAMGLGVGGQGSGGRQEVISGRNPKSLAGVFDGDTPADTRRKLRDHASIIFTNPDMLHTVMMPQHPRWAPFLSKLRLIVLDEMHVYSGIFGSNMANLLTRFFRLCRHYQGAGGEGPGAGAGVTGDQLPVTSGETAVISGEACHPERSEGSNDAVQGTAERDTVPLQRSFAGAQDDVASAPSTVNHQPSTINHSTPHSPVPRPLTPGPQVVACSATIGNPKELAEGLTGREFSVVDDDGSPEGKRTYVFWNPPQLRRTTYRSRRSANVEAHELMAMLVQRGVPTITFSKAKMTAEMIHRYVMEKLGQIAPHLSSKVSPYRGGYLPEERREIERRLFSGELMGVSTTPALELGIDVGGLDASIIVGYPGTLASFFQQSGRAGRQDRDSLVILIGLDTSVNQYVMSHPEYIFGRPVEEGVIDPEHPFVITGHLRCAAHEKPLEESETGLFGPHAPMVLKVLEENLKVKHIGDKWYHASPEIPQHEVTLRDTCDANVVIEDVDTGRVIGEVNKYDAPPILHPEAIYMHQGETYRVLSLDLVRNIARVKREEVDYYTQALGGTDIHHIDHCLREKPFGTGRAYWGEVTAYFQTGGYEKIHFYTLDAISRHPINDLPNFQLETMAFWMVPPEELMEKVRRSGLDAHSGLRGIAYATRMILPLFMTSNTLDFSHTVGSVNSPWNAIFIYERYPLGMGFTEKAYQRLHEIMAAVLENIRKCSCEDGCPCCVGKPLRQFTVWNVERGEAVIPSKASALMILEGYLGDGSNLQCPDIHSLVDSTEDDEMRLETAVRRRLERMREPEMFHPIEPVVPTKYPEIEKEKELPKADVERRSERRRSFDKELRKRIAKHIQNDQLPPNTARPAPPKGMKLRGSSVPPSAFSPNGKPEPKVEKEEQPPKDRDERPAKTDVEGARAAESADKTIRTGDSLAARARRLKKGRGTDQA